MFWELNEWFLKLTFRLLDGEVMTSFSLFWLTGGGGVDNGSGVTLGSIAVEAELPTNRRRAVPSTTA